MVATSKAKTVCIDTELYIELRQRVDELDGLFETLEIEQDEELMKEIGEARADFASSKKKTFTARELIKHMDA